MGNHKYLIYKGIYEWTESLKDLNKEVQSRREFVAKVLSRSELASKLLLYSSNFLPLILLLGASLQSYLMACQSIINVDHFVISHCFRSRLKETEVHRVTGKYKKDIHMRIFTWRINNMRFALQKCTVPKQSWLYNQRDCQILNHSDWKNPQSFLPSSK